MTKPKSSVAIRATTSSRGKRGGAAASGNPRVTAREQRTVSSDAGVSACIELMTRGHWVSGRSHAEVAKKYGVSPRTVEDWATSASRVIRLAIEGDKESIRARMVATLEDVQRRALAGKSKGELKAAVMAIDSGARLLGLVDGKKRDAPPPEYNALSDEQMLERVERQLIELGELRARLMAKMRIVDMQQPALPAKGPSDGTR